ncbi:acid phosphatase [Desulfovibrio sp. TomC]|uniref:acid phosphatase n=1 Tax=Desulfovibrio sp. TomC TaxID=1562888 RepID=UPI000573B1A1|nr:phosphatase PAP2 family protein [Desulfovibrio sp. TomC]KHK01042.1 Nonspecific acid phosphatase precursor [Desulfovibrio sp. TomC]
MRHLSRPFVLLLLFLLPQTGWSGEALFVSREQIDFARLLPPPPALDSVRQQREMDLLLMLQKERTPDMEAFALADAERSVFRFADAVGENFTAEKLPVAAAFFKAVKENGDELLGPAKKHWDRPRPYAANPAITPCVPKPGNASYPSGHSTFGTLMSIVLANMVPEKQVQIYDRAEQYRLNREIGGVHYPSDVVAGRIAGTVIAAFLFQSPTFLEDYAKARAEVRQVLGLPQ